MSQKVPRDMAASVKSRLLQSARACGEEFQGILTRYAIERFLYRLSRSPHRESFVVKGANLFLLSRQWWASSKPSAVSPWKTMA